MQNSMPLTNVDLIEEHSCQISSWSDLKWCAVPQAFLKRLTQQEEQKDG